MNILILLAALTGFYTGEREAGQNRICYYDVLGSEYAITIPIHQFCPLSIEVEE